MSASITIHPAAREALGAADWCRDMASQGYLVRLCLVHDQPNTTVTAWPSEMARSNATRQKMPRYRRQFHGTQPDGAA